MTFPPGRGKARYQAGRDWVGNDRHDDRDGGRGVPGCLGSERTIQNDHVDFVLDQFGGQIAGTRAKLAVGGSPIDHHIASLGVARIP